MIEEMVKGTRDALRAEIVYGDPIERDGTLVVPAAKVTGGAGAGGDAQHNEGGGFGLRARPVGAWVIRGSDVTWKPALDVNRIVLGSQIVAIIGLLVIRSVVKAWAKGRSAR